MVLRLLCLGLALLGALKIHALDSSSGLLSGQSLNEVALQRDFKDTWFQGKWYSIGVADNLNRNGEKRMVSMFSTTYDLQSDHSYKVTSALLRDGSCDTWVRRFVPSDHPGVFTLDNMPVLFGLQSYNVKVVSTNYHDFAIVYTEKTFPGKVLFSATLYGRTKELSAGLKEDFVSFAKSLGLQENDITFTKPLEQCIDG